MVRKKREDTAPEVSRSYSSLLDGIRELLESARRASARTVNAFMTATYWEIGRRIVEFEQGGARRAGYGEEVLKRLADDLTARLGRGFSRFNLGRFRQFYLAAPADKIRATLSLKSPSNPKRATPSLLSPDSSLAPPLAELTRAFPLPWSHYVLLMSRSRSPEAFAFYQTEALRGGWSVRQLQRQMDSQFYGLLPYAAIDGTRRKGQGSQLGDQRRGPRTQGRQRLGSPRSAT
jgi:hypothetical protein